MCLGLAYPPINFYFLIFAGYAMLLNIAENCDNYKQIFIRGYLTLLVFDLVATSWISLSGFRENADRFLILGGFFTLVLHAVYLTFPLFAYFFLKKNLSFKKLPNLHLIYFPLVWVAYEYISCRSEISFPWLLAGNSFTTNLDKIQFIEFTGVYGISLWIFIISTLIYYVFKILKSDFSKIRSGKIIFTMILIVILYIVPDFFTKIYFNKNNYDSKEKIIAIVIQPNINPWHKWEELPTKLVDDYLDIIKDAVNKYRKPDIIVMPETAFTFSILYPFYEDKYNKIKGLCDSLKIPILTGTSDVIVYTDSTQKRPDSKKFKSNGLYYDDFNSAILIEPGKDKSSTQKYAKIKLVIGSERMPYQEKLPFLKNLISWGVGLSSYSTGKDTTIFILNNKYKFNVAICYESIYPEFFSKFIDKGAEFSVIITNDGWWGKLFGTYQHNQYAILRAIENRRWIVRCANTGISDIIDPYGEMLDKTSINEKSIFIDEIGVRDQKTFYTKHGDVVWSRFMYLVIALILIGFIVKIFRRIKSPDIKDALYK